MIRRKVSQRHKNLYKGDKKNYYMEQINNTLSLLYFPDFSVVAVLNPLSPSFQICRNSL